MCNPCSSTEAAPPPAEEQQCQYHALAKQSFTRIRPDHPDTCYLGDSSSSSSGSRSGSTSEKGEGTKG